MGSKSRFMVGGGNGTELDTTGNTSPFTGSNADETAESAGAKKSKVQNIRQERVERSEDEVGETCERAETGEMSDGVGTGEMNEGVGTGEGGETAETAETIGQVDADEASGGQVETGETGERAETGGQSEEGHFGIHFHLQVTSNFGTTEHDFIIRLDNSTKTPRLIRFLSDGRNDHSTLQVLESIAQDYAAPQIVDKLFLHYDKDGHAVYFQRENALTLLRIHRPKAIIVLTVPWVAPPEFGGGGDDAVDPDALRFDVEGTKSNPFWRLC